MGPLKEEILFLYERVGERKINKNWWKRTFGVVVYMPLFEKIWFLVSPFLFLLEEPNIPLKGFFFFFP
jgi:hypothetical protein